MSTDNFVHSRQYRQDIKHGVPAYIAVSHAKMQLETLRQLQVETESRDAAIAEIEAFISEFDHV